MKTVDNKRRRNSVKNIKKAFVSFLQTREINEISVSEICKQANVNRSTFYANFLDIYDLADCLRNDLHNEVKEIFDDEITLGMSEQGGVLRLLCHIKENQIFYNTYFKLGYDAENQVDISDITVALDGNIADHINYHVEFFRTGFNAVVKLWLKNGCREAPEEIAQIFKNEYSGRIPT